MEKSNFTENCSYFIGNKDKNPVTILTKQIYEFLVFEHFKENTEKYRYFRSQGLAKDAVVVKGASACITFSAVCKDGHAVKSMVTYTGGQIADIDHIPAKEIPTLMALLAADPYAYTPPFRIVLLTVEELHGRKADENVSSDNANNQQLPF